MTTERMIMSEELRKLGVKIDNVDIATDTNHNMVTVTIIYRLPNFGLFGRRRLKALRAIMDNMPSKEYSCNGWCEAGCKTYRISYFIVPTGGIKYFNLEIPKEA